MVASGQRVRRLSDVVTWLHLIINLSLLGMLVLQLVQEADLVPLAVLLLAKVINDVPLILALAFIIIILNVNLLNIRKLSLLLLRDDLDGLDVVALVVLGELHHVLEVLDALLQDISGALGGVLVLDADVTIFFH